MSTKQNKSRKNFTAKISVDSRKIYELKGNNKKKQLFKNFDEAKKTNEN